MKTLKVIAACLIAAGLLGSPAFARQYQDNLERWVDIVNDSYLSIYQVQISNIDTDSWGRDLLGNEVIMGEDVMRVEPHNPNGYCRFDVRFTYEDGSHNALFQPGSFYFDLWDGSDIVHLSEERGPG